MSRRRIVPVLACVAALSGVALWAGIDAAAQQQSVREVLILDDKFRPHVLDVEPGTTVRWKYGPGALNPHTVTSQSDAPESFDSSPDCPGPGCMQAGDTFEYTFTKAGVYGYYCKPHGAAAPPPDPSEDEASQVCGMCAMVRVGGQANPTPVPQPTPAPQAQNQAPQPAPTAMPAAEPSPALQDGEEQPDAAGEVEEADEGPLVIVPVRPTPGAAELAAASEPQSGLFAAALASFLLASGAAVGFVAYRRRLGG